MFQNFYNMIQSQFQKNISVLQTDNRREYFQSILGDYLSHKGIVHQSSCVDTPQQNGVSERKNRHLSNVARMLTMNVPKYLWGDAILTTAFLINHLPSCTLIFKFPLSMLSHKFPHLNMLTNTLPLKTFSCTAFVHIYSQHQTKLDPQAIKTIFIGYSPTQKGYQCYCPQTNKTFVTRDITFF